jgi:RNA polymerase sigma-70 factor (ECF subfamily)
VSARAETATDADRSIGWFDDHFDAVVRFFLRIGTPADQVEDLAQEVFVAAHRRRADYDGARPLRPWLYGIAFNVARDWRKRAQHRYEVPTDDVAEAHGRTDPGIRRVEAAQLVHRALRALPEPRRVVLVLHELEQVPVPEIAHALGIPEDTVYGRLRTGRDEFRAAVLRLQRGAA